MIEDRTSKIDDAATTGRAYWRSLDELADTPRFRAFVESEFPSYAPELVTGPSRRQFLKIMGASLALAGFSGLAGCRRWPRRELAPYAHRPENRVPGDKEFFATAMELAGVARPLLVTCADGRPVKIEGNPDHPASRGAADLYSQASILDLYDPHRARQVKRAGEESSWQAFEQWWVDKAKAFEASGGRGFVVLSELTRSPTVERLKAKLLQQYPNTKWRSYDPVNRNAEIIGTKLAFGKAMRPVYDLTEADVIVSLDSDLLMRHPDSIRLARQFAQRRRSADDDGTMSRLYVAEPTFTVTGTMADERLPANMDAIAQLAEQLAIASGAAGGARLKDDSPVARFAGRIVEDLQTHGDRALVVAGPDQPVEVHALVAGINLMRGHVGRTVRYIEDDTPLSVNELPDDIDTLVILGGNPAYDAPFAASAEHTIHLTHEVNDTSDNRAWILPRAHYLEAWGDCRAWDGTVTVRQPMIQPLFGGRSTIELLQVLLGGKPDGLGAVRATHHAAADEKAWRKTVHDGLLANSAWKAQRVSTTAALRSVKVPPARPRRIGEFDVLLRPDYALHDGRFANNGWLQELPDPITTLTWDNAALISPADCAKLGIGHGGVLSINGRDVPVYPMPGQAEGLIVLPIGYGRSVVGPVGQGVGFDARAVVGPAGERTTVTVTGREHKLATTQDHHAIDVRKFDEANKRVGQLIREGTLEAYRHHPNFAEHLGLHVLKNEDGMPLQQWEPPVDFDQAADQQWAMAVDLTSCIGCNACVVACQAENNIPIVGKDEVASGREMHWIRVDRYFTGPPDHAASVRAVHQPIMCQHCENAPCEQVCPVAATVHDSEGLNVMVYNRCIGTRYCSNNCPYKVRRFNYYDYHAKDPHAAARPWNAMPDTQQQARVGQIERMQFNPQVTVRMRGVMEKCTFCTQRIQEAKITAKVDGKELKDGDVTPACAQTCPTGAIVFGDLKDPNSRVRKLHEKNHRTYGILSELNTRPRTKYLARVRNPKTGSHGEHH